jgi:hypothetical protein
MRALPLFATLCLSLACGTDGITYLAPDPPPPPPPVTPGPAWDVRGSIQMVSQMIPQSVITGYQVRIDGELVTTYSGPPTKDIIINFERFAVPAGGTHEVSIRMTGQTVTHADYFVQGTVTAVSHQPASQTRSARLKSQQPTLSIGHVVTMEFEVPP